MKPKDEITEERIPMFVESQRGDDRIGTDPGGSLITDHVATENGVPFESGVPQNKIQEAVEKQLIDDKWVVLEKKSGASELLVKGDIPESKDESEETAPEEGVAEDELSEGDAGTGTSGDPEKTEDWKQCFRVVPPKPETPAAIPGVIHTAVPKKDKEIWKSKFANVKSATATHKGKGG